jgi:hypothetical protein
MSHTNHQIHNIVYDRQNKFDNYIVHDKRKKTETTASESKERLWRCVVAVGSSHRVQEGITKFISLPAACDPEPP